MANRPITVGLPFLISLKWQVMKPPSSDFHLPAHACASWRELYRALAELEVELMDHIHLENNILFPRALAG